MNENVIYYSIYAALIAFALRKISIRLQLSRAKHPSLRGHAKWSRRIAKLIPYFEYSTDTFFSADAAPADIARKRKDALSRLIERTKQQSPDTIAFSASLEDSISDLRFTTAYRVPFPFRNFLARELKLGSIADETSGVKIKDIDNNWRFDLSGSYGVNIFGYDFYKSCMEKGFEKVKSLGPVLGPYHPLIRENVEKIKKISGLDEVSFHMSGTEAVMQAVRLARYHTGRTHLVRFCGAYHGWWDGVQPGIGNQRKTNDVYTLSDLSEQTLKVLETRKDIACILINPLQAFHPNSDSASDSTLINSSRSTNFNKQQYSEWLNTIRDICTRRNIVLIFDEVFTGFRLGYRGAQEFFGIQADIVTYGKSIGGGLPVGVVCGRHDLMKRFKDNSPVNVSFARGTFNSHPYLMASMNEFLNRIENPEYQLIYRQAEHTWNTRIANANRRFEAEELPIRLTNMHSIVSILYTVPSRYNWMFQFYLRAEGVELGWIGSGRLIMSLNYTDQDFEEVTQCILNAARLMQADQWWWHSKELTNKTISRLMLRDMFTARFPLLGRLLKQPEKTSTKETVREAN